jgi:hypothetical protein
MMKVVTEELERKNLVKPLHHYDCFFFSIEREDKML